MVNAPTRPPGRPRSERRTPKGPLVALRPDDQQHRDNLVTAAQVLRDIDRPELAGSVDLVLSPLGLPFLTRVQPGSGQASNLPIRMPKSNRDLIHELKAASLASVLNWGFQSFLDGEFEVRKEPRRRIEPSDPSVVLSVSPDRDLHADVARRCRELKEDGHKPVLTVSTVAAAILYAHFEIGAYAPDGKAAVHRELVQAWWRDEYGSLLDDAALSPRDLTGIVENGLRGFLDGSLDLLAEPRPVGQKGQSTSGRVLKIQVMPELLAEAGELFKRLQVERSLPGYLGTSTTVVAALYEHFGIGPYAPESASTE